MAAPLVHFYPSLLRLRLLCFHCVLHLPLEPFTPTTLQICTTSSLSAMTTVAPPSHSVKYITQPLMVEASSFSPFIIPSYPSTAGGKRHCITTIISWSDEISDSSNEDTPKKSTQMPSRSTVPQANVQMALPAVKGHVCIWPSLQFSSNSSNTHIILQKMRSLSIECLNGLALTSHQSLCTCLGLSYVLSTMVDHVLWQWM